MSDKLYYAILDTKRLKIIMGSDNLGKLMKWWVGNYEYDDDEIMTDLGYNLEEIDYNDKEVQEYLDDRYYRYFNGMYCIYEFPVL